MPPIVPPSSITQTSAGPSLPSTGIMATRSIHSCMAFVMCGTTLNFFFFGVISTRTRIKTEVTKTDETKSSPHHVIQNTWTVFPKYSPILSLSITDWHKPQNYNL